MRLHRDRVGREDRTNGCAQDNTGFPAAYPLPRDRLEHDQKQHSVHDYNIVFPFPEKKTAAR